MGQVTNLGKDWLDRDPPVKIKVLKAIFLAVATGLCVAGCGVHISPPAAEVAVSDASPPPLVEVDVRREALSG